MQHQTLKIVCAVATLALGAFSIAHAADAAAKQRAAQPVPSWHGQSLTTATVTGPNGANKTDTIMFL